RLSFTSHHVRSVIRLSLVHLPFAVAPGTESLLHVGMSKERAAKLTQHWPVDHATHVRAARDLLGCDVNLKTVAIGVGDGRAENHSIQPSPERVGHAHRTRLTGGVHGISGQGRTLQLFA